MKNKETIFKILVGGLAGIILLLIAYLIPYISGNLYYEFHLEFFIVAFLVGAVRRYYVEDEPFIGYLSDIILFTFCSQIICAQELILNPHLIHACYLLIILYFGFFFIKEHEFIKKED